MTTVAPAMRMLGGQDASGDPEDPDPPRPFVPGRTSQPPHEGPEEDDDSGSD